MVSVPTKLAGLSAMATMSITASASVASLPTFDIPAFDYTTLQNADVPNRMLQSLQTDGIIALKNIPNYANLRERYLLEAAQCAALNADVDTTNFVSRKLFADGTNRMTISTNAGRELSGSAMATDAACPGFRELYEEFSATVERAVNTFGSVLDRTAFTASDGQNKRISSRQLVADAVRLDHFHAYEAATSATSAKTDADAAGAGASRRLTQQSAESEMSLPLHEDHGLFIAMSAPKWFEVDTTKTQSVTSHRQLTMVERALAADASGLIMQTSSGQRVRPVLHADEVVIMMGTGASRWLQTSHALPAVLHGMKMPEPLVASASAGRRSLRAWFGKMTLLPAYQRMLLNNGMAFESHVNATTRYLLSNDASELKTVGCATGRHLAASEGKCTLRTCSTKAGASPPDEPCSVICNRVGHSDDDAPTCAEKCTCTANSSPAEICWMLCVATLSDCPADKQTCKGQALVCPTPTTTAPTPTTTKPTTTKPTPTTPGTTTKAPSPTTKSPTDSQTTPAPGTTTTETPETSSPSGTTPAPTSSLSSSPSPSSANPGTPSNPSDASAASNADSETGSGDDVVAPSSTTSTPSTTPSSAANSIFITTTVATTALAACAALL